MEPALYVRIVWSMAIVAFVFGCQLDEHSGSNVKRSESPNRLDRPTSEAFDSVAWSRLSSKFEGDLNKELDENRYARRAYFNGYLAAWFYLMEQPGKRPPHRKPARNLRERAWNQGWYDRAAGRGMLRKEEERVIMRAEKLMDELSRLRLGHSPLTKPIELPE